MNKLSQAICFATEAFDGQVRKGENFPVIFHSLEAAAIVQGICPDEDVVCAAVLHDTVEDAGVSLAEIRERFGERVMQLVNSETENKYPKEDPSASWRLRKEETLQLLRSSHDEGVKALWLGDKLSNMRSLSRLHARLGADMWSLFHQRDPQAHAAYYRAIVAELSAFADTSAYRELNELINNVFGA